MVLECSPEAVYKVSLSREPVPAEVVREWMECGDLRVMGVLWHHVIQFNPERVTPGLSREEIQALRFAYYAGCLAEDPHGHWVDDRIRAAKDVVRWFWRIEEIGPDDLDPEDVKAWLADTYLHGDEDTRSAIVERILARICEYRVWREFFADWESDAGLREAYSAATALEHILEQPCYRPFFTHWAQNPVLRESHAAAMHWAAAHETE